VPIAHSVAERQQPAQLAGPHCSLHWWPWQISPLASQFVHLPPLGGPQALSALPPRTHVLPSQQPFAQVAGEHRRAWHDPDAQTRPCAEQLTHAPPPTPHATSWFSRAQTSPTQHVGQLSGLQSEGGRMHAPVA
jgi:hypothetical protein